MAQTMPKTKTEKKKTTTANIKPCARAIAPNRIVWETMRSGDGWCEFIVYKYRCVEHKPFQLRDISSSVEIKSEFLFQILSVVCFPFCFFFCVWNEIDTFQCWAFILVKLCAHQKTNISQMCNWTKVLATILIVYLKCALTYSRRGPFRVFRKSAPPPFPAIMLSLPPPRAAAQNFNAEYELPPYMMMPSMSPPSTSYGEPIMEYGPPRPDYGPPKPEYGPPRPDYGPPRPEYGPPRPEYSPPKQEYGPPPMQEYGPPSSTMKPIVHKHIYVHIPPPEPEIQTSRQLIC